MSYDVDHIYLRLSAFCIPAGEVSLQTLYLFLMSYFLTISYYKSYLRFKSSFCILDISPLSDMFYKYIFSQSMAYLSILLSFAGSKLILINMITFTFMNYTFWHYI